MADQQIFGEQLRQLQRKLGIFNQCQVSCCGISPAQCFTLAELNRNEGISLGELAVRQGVDNSTMSRTVNSLVNFGLVQRTADPTDRRYVSLSLTSAGQKVAAEIENALDHQLTRVWELIPTNQRERVVESLHVLIQALGHGCCQ